MIQHRLYRIRRYCVVSITDRAHYAIFSDLQSEGDFLKGRFVKRRDTPQGLAYQRIVQTLSS